MGSSGTLLLLGCIGFVLAQTSINDRLDERLRQTKIEIAKLHFREEPPVEQKVYNVKWDQSWRKNLDQERPFVTNAFDKILVVEGNRFIAISPDASSNSTIPRETISTLNAGLIKFVRSIVWKGILYLLVCHGGGSCSVYTGTENLQLKHRQTIQHKGCPVDASFFVRANRLYLVVADNSGQFYVPSLIYHWRGTYMDVTAEVMTIAAVSVTTFKHKQSTIIVFAQNNGISPGVGSMVYEFKDTSLDRIQLLPTTNPISVHHCPLGDFHFVLLVNEREPSNLFWWDDHQLLHWQQVPEIQAPNLVHIVSIDGDTLFFVAYGDVLQVYKFENASKFVLLGSMRLDKMPLIDILTRIDKSTITMVLVTVNSTQIYNMEAWNLLINEIPSAHSIKESEVLSKHLAELVEMLRNRKPLIEKAEALLPLLLPADDDLTVEEVLAVENVELVSGVVKNIDIFVDEEIMTPRELEESLKNLIGEVDDALTMSKELLTWSNTNNTINGDIVVDGDAFIEELQVNKMDVNIFNGVDMHSSDAIGSNGTQESSTSLNAKTIIVEDLQVDTICGIPFQYWSLNSDTSKIEINPGADEIEILNDTVHINSNVSLTNLNVKTLNGTDVDKLFNELFIINRNQRIKGNVTYTDVLQIRNLTVQTLNGKPWNDYMNTETNQTFEKFVVRRLHVENLYADTINGVPVSEAARISTKNVIKGETRIARLHVTDELIVDSSFKLPAQQQIYADVTIHGNLKINTLDLDRRSKILVNDQEINLNGVLDTYWTKSTDQVIENDVIFENALTVDHLKAKYLNGFTEDQFLYTTATSIPETFKNLHFENVRVNDMFFVAGKKNDGFFYVAPESVTIRERLHLRHLHGNQLFVETFNDLPVTDILSGKRSHTFPRNTSFSAIKAEQLHANELNFRLYNGKDSVSIVENVKNVGEPEKMKFMKAPEVHGGNLEVERINEIEMKRLLSLRDVKMSELKNLIVYGDLKVRGDLQVEQIDDRSATIYLEDMIKNGIVFDTKMAIDELIVENATLKSLHGHQVDGLFDGFLSKSRDQVIPGRFSFYKVTTDNIETKFINNHDTSKLMWIDEPMVLTGNVTFDHLFVDGDVVTKTLNDRDVNELYENLLNVSISEINDLTVEGNVSWDVPSTDSSSLTYLFENAVTKATNQTITGDTIFQNNVTASAISAQLKVIEDIRSVIEDAVIDDGDIEIDGRKIFKENLDIDSLSVTGDINIPRFNDIDIVEFNKSVVRRDRNETITGFITFHNEVAIDQLLVNDTDHNVPLKGAVLATDTLPSNVVFKNLVILEDVYLKNLDGIDFDEFLKNRITIDGDHEIVDDVQFNGIVEIIGNANVSRINDIDPSDLVLNGTEEMQVISGSKIFEEDVIVDGSIYVPLINGVNVSSEYSNGVQNDEDVDIFGDLVFESQVKVPGNVTVSNTVNGVNLHTLLDDLQQETSETLEMFKRNETKINKSIAQSSSILKNLKNVFAYLEEEERLKIQAPNIKKVDVVYYKQITKLNLFGEEPGPRCGLPDNCFCPTEYMAELTEEDCRVRRTNGTKTVRNYHEYHDTFGVNVMTNTISYSRECTSNNTENEFITISWMRPTTIESGDTLANVKKTSLEIRGFIKDADVFMTHNDTAFVVLAVYYDTLFATHSTNSVIYKIDLENDVLSLHQKLPTDGASAIEIFKTNDHDLYLLIGCFGESQQSFLYRLDPITLKFTLMRRFGGKTRNVRSLFQENNHFVLLDDFDTNAINIFHYDSKADNFYDYQNLFHDSRINGLECFYADEFGKSDSFIIVTTENDRFYIYEYMFIQKFQLKIHHRIDDLQAMVPFYYLGNSYIFTGTSTNSTILRIVKQGPN